MILPYERLPYTKCDSPCIDIVVFRLPEGDVAMAPSPSTTGSRKSARLQRKGGGKGKCRCKEPIQQERKRRGVPLPVKNKRPEQEGEEEEETSKADPTDSPSQLTMMTRSLRKRSLEGPHAATKESSSSVQGAC